MLPSRILALLMCLTVFTEREVVVGQEAESTLNWRKFDIRAAEDFLSKGIPFCVHMPTRSTIGASSVSIRSVQNHTAGLLKNSEVVLMVLSIDDLPEVPSRFVDRYLKRTVPSFSIISGEGAVYTLSGHYSKDDIDKLLAVVFSPSEGRVQKQVSPSESAAEDGP